MGVTRRHVFVPGTKMRIFDEDQNLFDNNRNRVGLALSANIYYLSYLCFIIIVILLSVILIPYAHYLLYLVIFFSFMKRGLKL